MLDRAGDALYDLADWAMALTVRTSYHLDLDARKIRGARYVLMPGDPFRSPVIAQRVAERYGRAALTGPIAHQREYCTYLTEIAGARVLITSTGIGGPSTAIAIDELAQLGVRTFIRVGTTGAIQSHLGIGDVVITSGSVRLDGASTHYAPIEYPAVAHYEVLLALIEAAKVLKSDKVLRPEIKGRYHVGITASSDTFYPGQERDDSFSGYVLHRFQGMTEQWRRLKVLNYEMESSTVLTLCSALGLRGGCVSGVVVNRSRGGRISPRALRMGEEHAIQVAIRAVEVLVNSLSN